MLKQRQKTEIYAVLDSARARLVAALVFIVMVALMGGGSRSDIASLPFLRAGAILFAAYAAWVMPPGHWRTIRTPLLFLAALAGWIALQLVPLPPGLWTTLPQRDMIAETDSLLGLGEIWRPISLTPSMTWNALLSLTVPLAVLVLFNAVDPADRQVLLLAMVMVGAFSIAIGLFQLMAGPDSLFYFYRITNQTEMVGLFANRNHHAVFLALVMLAASLAMRFGRSSSPRASVGALGYGLLIPACFIMLLAIGSRAGLLCGIIATLVVVRNQYLAPSLTGGTGRKPAGQPVMALVARIAVPLVGVGLLIAGYTLGDRFTSVQRAADTVSGEEMRVQTFSVVADMAQTHLLAGSGFGSFKDVYRVVEPDALLQPAFYNHAHDDWIQWVIEGGLPAAILLILFLVWLVRQLRVPGARSLWVAGGEVRLTLGAMLVILFLASAVDYPLRVPLMQTLGVWILLATMQERRALMNPGAELAVRSGNARTPSHGKRG